jgi:DNA mismatch repair ATPase MutS
MTFHSILFARTENSVKDETLEAPVFFVDLNLDQIVDAVTAGRQEYNLKPFFYTSLNDTDAVKYRHEVLQDLENTILFGHIESFARKMRSMREHNTQANKLYYKYQKESWFLDAVAIYCDAVNCLVQDLSRVDIKSRGFLGFRTYLANYVESSPFRLLLEETTKLKADLSTETYCLVIKGIGITVRSYQSEIDYSAEVEKTFAKFKQGAVKDYRVKFPDRQEINHIEARALDFVAKLYPDIFSHLDGYCADNRDYLDETIAAFDRQIQFYIAYLDFTATFKRTGLKLCYPQISNSSKELYNYEGFDLALAYKLIGENSSVVCNDFNLKGGERIFVVSGPNQGGQPSPAPLDSSIIWPA